MENEQAFARVRKRVPSREKAEQVRAIGLSLCTEHTEPVKGCDACDDARLLVQTANLLLDLRQAVRGGTNGPASSRWMGKSDLIP